VNGVGLFQLTFPLGKQTNDGEHKVSRHVVLIHGYSDKGRSFQTWRTKLSSGNPAWEIDTIGIGSYQSLTDEVTINPRGPYALAKPMLLPISCFENLAQPALGKAPCAG
jgi:hypothetical protein